MIIVKMRKELRNFEHGTEMYTGELVRDNEILETLSFPNNGGDIKSISASIKKYCRSRFDDDCFFIPDDQDDISIKVKYFTDDIMKLEKISKGDWIDLRAAKDMDIKAGDHVLIPLGIALELPKGYEAIVAPRSSTFKNWGLLQTNSIGIIDESYCGDNDQWFMSVYATRDTSISLNDRVCQFRIIKHQPMFSIEEVDSLGNKDRGGHGSTGTK